MRWTLPRMTRWLLSLSLIAGVLAAAPAAAQVSGHAVLRGEVRDSVGERLGAVDVIVRRADGQVVAGTSTGRDGRYLLMSLPPGGPYAVEFARPGYAPVTRTELYMAVGERRRMDAVLVTQPLGLDPIEVVTAADAVMNPGRRGASTVLDERTVQTVPTVERDYVAFAALSPMVSVDRATISVAGQNSRFNSLRVDGVVAQDVFGLSPTGVPGGQANAKALPLDAIRQYTVEVAPFDVRQSGFTGGILNAVTRSGGEAWEGRVFGFYRGGALTRTSDDSDVVRARGYGVSEGFRTETMGITAGGPLGPARLFVAAEYERRRRPVPGFNLGQEETFRVGLVADSVARLQQVLADTYGMDAGAAGSYTLENPLGNVFGRLDVPVGDRSDLTLRYLFIAAAEDRPPARFGFDAYELGSGGTRLESTTHGGMARLVTRLSERTSNELSFSVQHTADATRTRSLDPQVEVQLITEVDTLVFGRKVLAGGSALAHDDALAQSTVQVAERLRHALGDHLFTVGLEASLFRASRRFLPASRGIWRFGTMAGLEANQPISYERLVLREGVEPAVGVDLVQASAYIQDDWSLGRRLEVSLGVRVDVPTLLDAPGHNPLADSLLGIATSTVPASTPLLAPRLAFNWDPGLPWGAQVRGGIGVFTGTPPLAWISDAYAETGLRTFFIECTGDDIPPLVLLAPRTNCGTIAPRTPSLTFFDEDFHYPQDLRASLALDQQLPLGFTGTLEGVYTRALHQVTLSDANLLPPEPGPYPDSLGYPEVGDRPLFGTPLLNPTRFGPLDPRRRTDAFGRALRIGSGQRNAAVSVAGELRRRFGGGVDVRLAYTYTRALDTGSLRYQNTALNYGLTAVRGDPGDPAAELSAFARPHRVLASIGARLADWGAGLDASLLYIGQSGLPYSYVYASDVNGDGFPGPGAIAEGYNDLLSVPIRLSDVPVTGIIQRKLVLDLARLDPCLEEFAGRVLSRNTCRTPWTNQLDLRLAQAFDSRIGRIQVTGDLLNVLNLLDPSWGLVQVAPSVVPLIQYTTRRADCPGFTCGLDSPLSARYVGPRVLSEATGQPVAELPYITSLPESQWRAQLGVSVAF